MEEVTRRTKEASKDQREANLAVRDSVKEVTAKAAEYLKLLDGFKGKIVRDPFETGSNAAIERIEKFQKQADKLLKSVSKDPQNIKDLVSLLNLLQKELFKLDATRRGGAFDTKGIRVGGIGSLLGFAANAPREDGSLLLDGETTAQQIRDNVAKLRQQLKQVNADRIAAEKRTGNLALLRAEIAKKEEAVLKRIGEETKKRLGVERTAREAINATLDGTLQRLERVRQLNDEIARGITREQPAPPPPGGGGFFAFGGRARGIDRHPAMLADNETVMTQLASRQFAPVLAAFNAAAPKFGTQSQSSVNFGDITINTAPGTTDAQLSEIAAGLQRYARMGRFQI